MAGRVRGNLSSGVSGKKSGESIIYENRTPIISAPMPLAIGPPMRELQEERAMNRVLAFIYGVGAYALCLGTLLYAIGFIGGFAVPKTVDSGPAGPVSEALIVNTLLLLLFALQHSVMARKPFKRWWTQIVPAAIERSTYVLLASLVLVFLFWQWRPMPAIVWQVTNPALQIALVGLAALGWAIVFLSTVLINHFELFGLQQVLFKLIGKGAAESRFKTPLLYKVVRHPLYLGFLIAFWATPVMTAGHLLFSAIVTLYILLGIALEERDLIELFGDEYRRYRERVSMLLPLRWRSEP
jgi:protein-S-isoprenylcysteine O-methyltransferase Ste14